MLPQSPKSDLSLIRELVDELNKISNYQWEHYGVDEVWVRFGLGNRSFGYSHRVSNDQLRDLPVPLSVIAGDILTRACVNLGHIILAKE